MTYTKAKSRVTDNTSKSANVSDLPNGAFNIAEFDEFLAKSRKRTVDVLESQLEDMERLLQILPEAVEEKRREIELCRKGNGGKQ